MWSRLRPRMSRGGTSTSSRYAPFPAQAGSLATCEFCGDAAGDDDASGDFSAH
jgi:hypothetical protein